MYISLVRDLGTKDIRKRFTGWNLVDNDPRRPVRRFASDAHIRKQVAIRNARKDNPRS
jgi:hypothetical protein